MGLAADIGTLARLPKVVGNHSLLHELAYTARNFSAAEAEKLGLVSRVVQGSRDEVLAAALQTAQLIAEKSPIAVLGSKHLLLHARDHTYVWSFLVCGTGSPMRCFNAACRTVWITLLHGTASCCRQRSVLRLITSGSFLIFL